MKSNSSLTNRKSPKFDRETLAQSAQDWLDKIVPERYLDKPPKDFYTLREICARKNLTRRTASELMRKGIESKTVRMVRVRATSGLRTMLLPYYGPV
jgi:hypothetical protein